MDTDLRLTEFKAEFDSKSLCKNSLRSRRLEVVGTRKNARERTITPCVSPSGASVLSFAHYFQAPATQASVKTFLNTVFQVLFFFRNEARFKRRAAAVLNSIDRIKFDFSTAVARRLKPSRATQTLVSVGSWTWLQMSCYRRAELNS